MEAVRLPLIQLGPSRRFTLQDLFNVANFRAKVDLDKAALERLTPPKVLYIAHTPYKD
jgi:hypothetical protein